jgi:hypothetical protein
MSGRGLLPPYVKRGAPVRTRAQERLAPLPVSALPRFAMGPGGWPGGFTLGEADALLRVAQKAGDEAAMAEGAERGIHRDEMILFLRRNRRALGHL